MKVTMSKVESGVVTRQRLLEAAEQLFAEQGFEKVTVRDVTEKAGANVAAVNYHFGSREGLVEKVIERYLTPINEERMARLESLERKAGGKPVALEEILDAFVRPFLTQIRRSELNEKLSFRLIGRMLGDDAGKMPAQIEAQFQMVVQRFMRAVGKAMPGVAEEELLWRMHFMAGAMIHAMAHEELLFRVTHGACGSPSMEQTLSRFVRFSAAGLKQESGGGNVSKDEAGKKAEPPQSEFLF